MKISVRHKCPTLDLIGLGVERFPYYQRPLRNRPVPLHSHDMLEMVYLLNGEGVHRVGEVDYPMRPGELGIVHFGQEHAIGEGRLDLINIYLDPQMLELPVLPPELLRHVPRLLPVNPELSHNLNLATHLSFPPATARVVEDLLLSVLREQGNQSCGYLEAMRLLWRMFLIHCLRRLGEEQLRRPKKAQEPDAWLETLRQSLDKNYRRPVSLPSLARRFGASRGHLCRCFRRYTGRTIYEYVLQRRIEAAIVDLLATPAKIIAIAAQSGFNDVSFFNRTFRRFTGTTPGDYRKLHSQQ